MPDHATATTAPVAHDCPAATELADLRRRLTILAAIEEHIGESCGNASHNLRDVLNGLDPRPDAAHYGLPEGDLRA